jgi:voltage-dependent calcium channel L type alpha-1D
LKGTFNQCVTDGLSDEQVQYLTYPVTWADATAAYPSSAEWLAGTACEAPLMEGLSVAPDSQTLCACMLGSSAWQAVIPQNFDNVFKAMGTLYEIATTEGWLDVMYAAIDQRGIGMQPVENNQLWWIGFFVLFMIFGSFFIMNLFVGVVIDNFNRIKSSRGAVFMTKEQEEWQKMQRLVDKIKPKRVFAKPLNPWNAACYSIMMRPSFDTFIIWCIILNSIVMAMPYFGQTYPYSLALEWVNYAFALIFTMECIIKISGIGRNYFDEAWNRFDFTIVVGTLVSWRSYIR